MSEWLSIPDFPQYSVGDQGCVRNDDSGRILKTVALPDGRLKVGLYREGLQYQRSVSRLVISAFVPNADPWYSDTPIHLDGQLGNCAAYNLAWRPRWFAKTFTRQFRFGHPDTPPIFNVDTEEEYSGIWELVMKYGLLRVEILQGIGRDWPIYPLMQRFDWLSKKK